MSDLFNSHDCDPGVGGGVAGTAVTSVGEQQYEVLTADGAGGASWEFVEGVNVKSTGELIGLVLTTDGLGSASWQSPGAGFSGEGDDLLSTGEPINQILVSDGADGDTWEDYSTFFQAEFAVSDLANLGTKEADDLDATGIAAGQLLRADGANGTAWFDPTAGDPFTQYLLESAFNATFDARIAVTDAANLTSGVATDNFVLTADGAGGAAWESLNSGVVDHGLLGGLGDDDHTQYHTDARALTWLMGSSGLRGFTTTNVWLGQAAGASVIAGGGLNNTLIGHNSGDSISTGGQNVGLGRFTLDDLTTGSNNIAVGDGALTSLLTASGLVAIGTNSQSLNQAATGCVSLGNATLGAIITGALNSTAVGHNALTLMTEIGRAHV